MIAPKGTMTRLDTPADLDFGDFTQDIASPLDYSSQRDEPTLTKIDFDDLEFAFDF